MALEFKVKRWLIFLELADEKGKQRIPFLATFGMILITLAPVAAITGKLSTSSIIVGIVSLAVGVGILLFVRSSKRP